MKPTNISIIYDERVGILSSCGKVITKEKD